MTRFAYVGVVMAASTGCARNYAPPQPTPEAWGSPTGSIPKRHIQQIVDANRDQIRTCYKEGLADHPDLAGRVFLKWQILEDGTVGAVMLNESTMEDKAVEACMVASIKQWRFARPSGGWVEVNYPYIFRTN